MALSEPYRRPWYDTLRSPEPLCFGYTNLLRSSSRQIGRAVAPLQVNAPNDVLLSWFSVAKVEPAVSRFAYFEYQGTLPPIIYSSHRKRYWYIVEVSKKESDGSDRSGAELLRATKRLFRNSLEDSNAYGENILDLILGSPPTEVDEEDFRRMNTEKVDPLSTVPGGVYRVRRS